MCSGLTRVRSGWMTLAAWSTETRKVPPRRGAWAEARRDKPDSAGNPAAEARTARRVGCLILSLLCLRLSRSVGHIPCKVHAIHGLESFWPRQSHLTLRRRSGRLEEWHA